MEHTYPKGVMNVTEGDCAMLLSPSGPEQENTLLLGSEQQPLLREEVALSSSQSLMYASTAQRNLPKHRIISPINLEVRV